MTQCALCGSKDYLAMHREFIPKKAMTQTFWLCIECHRAVHNRAINLEKELEKKKKKPEVWSVS